MRRSVAVFLTAGLFLGIAAVAIAAVTGPTDIKTTSAEEQNPAASATWFAWTQRNLSHPNQPNVYVDPMPIGGGDSFKVNPSGTRAWTGGIDGNTLAYQRIANGQSDIRLFDLVTKTDIGGGGANTSQWEWHPTISTDTTADTDQWILFGRQNLRTGVQKVIARNIDDGTNRVVGEVFKFRHAAIPGQVNGDWATWTICKSSCNVWYVNLTNASSPVRVPKPTASHQYGSSITPDGVVYYVKSGNACGKNVKIARHPVGTTNPIVQLSSGRDIFTTFTSQEGADNHVYYDRVVCSTGHWNIYKVVESP